LGDHLEIESLGRWNAVSSSSTALWSAGVVTRVTLKRVKRGEGLITVPIVIVTVLAVVRIFGVRLRGSFWCTPSSRKSLLVSSLWLTGGCRRSKPTRGIDEILPDRSDKCCHGVNGRYGNFLLYLGTSLNNLHHLVRQKTCTSFRFGRAWQSHSYRNCRLQGLE
jgi:hypothetical protein